MLLSNEKMLLWLSVESGEIVHDNCFGFIFY